LQRNEIPSRLYSAADLEAGPPPPEQDAANDKQMDAFFKEVAAIKVLSCKDLAVYTLMHFATLPGQWGMPTCCDDCDFMLLAY